MAYRRSGRRTRGRRSSFRRGSGSRRMRSFRARSSSRRFSRGARRGASRTVRIVLEQAGASSVGRVAPGLLDRNGVVTAPAAGPRRARF